MRVWKLSVCYFEGFNTLAGTRDMIPRFGRPAHVLSMVTNGKVIDFIYDTHGWRIKQWNHDLLSTAHLQTYADAVYAKGAALENCFGFVDGTVRPIARPGEIKEWSIMDTKECMP